jgi:hypothetical protein
VPITKRTNAKRTRSYYAAGGRNLTQDCNLVVRSTSGGRGRSVEAGRFRSTPRFQMVQTTSLVILDGNDSDYKSGGWPVRTTGISKMWAAMDIRWIFQWRCRRVWSDRSESASLLDPVAGRRASRGMHFSKVIAAQTIGCIRLPDQVTPPRIDLLILFQLADGESQS